MRAVLVALAALGLLALVPATPAAASPERVCAFSPTRGWELDRGGKACRTFTRRYLQRAERVMGGRPATVRCSTRRPKRIWRCSAARWRTTNIERGDILQGRFQKVGGRWRVRGLHYPTPRY